MGGFVATVITAGYAHAQEAKPEPIDVLNTLYLTVALVDFCNLEVDPVIGKKVALAGFQLERSLGIDQTTALANLDAIKEGFFANPPDCTPGSADIGAVSTILGVR